jgi:phosphoglycolate phosphatase
MKKLSLAALFFIGFSTFASMSIKTLIFDFDGTIADSHPSLIECINELAPKYSYKPLKNVDALRGKDSMTILKKDLGLSIFSFWGYKNKIISLMHEKMKTIKPFDGIKASLEKLSKEYKLAILTSTDKEDVEMVLKNGSITTINPIFSDFSIFGKHWVIQRFLKKEKLNKDEVLFIGDETRDIEACRKAGVKVAAAAWGLNTKEFLEKQKPDFLFEKPKDLIKLLKPKKESAKKKKPETKSIGEKNLV